MGLLDSLFQDSHGLTNLLIDSFGGEALIETLLEDVYDEDTDTSHSEYSRQIVPAVIQAHTHSAVNSTSPQSEIPSLVGDSIVYIATVSAANLYTPPVPFKTTLRVKNERFQVISADPAYVGNIRVSYKLTMRKL